MIKEWMEFCDAIKLDAKLTAETIADELARDRDQLANVFYKLATDLPRKSTFTVFVSMDTGHYIAAFHAYTIEDAKAQALIAARQCNASDKYTVVGVADGDITLLEWTDEA